MPVSRRDLNTVLFDLDGTLLDTAADLCAALNQLLRQEGRPALPLSDVRAVVSKGGSALVQKGFDLPLEHPEFESLRQRLLQLYSDRICVHTALFPGMQELLTFIEAKQWHWGVVTNKPAWLTDPLMRAVNLHRRAACIVSGDTTEHRKPHPAPLWHACEQIGAQAHRCLYVGDHARDIEAGNRAGMATAVALFGYLDLDDQPQTWQADTMIEHPMQLAEWIMLDA